MPDRSAEEVVEAAILKSWNRCIGLDTYDAGQEVLRALSAAGYPVQAGPQMREALEAVVSYFDEIEGEGEGGMSRYDVPAGMARAALTAAKGETT